MIRAAQRERGKLDRHAARRLTFVVGNERCLPVCGRDIVLCSLALMMCRQRAQLHAVMRGLVHSLAPDGRLVIVVTHPAFRHTAYETFRYVLPQDYDYWTGGQAYRVVLTPGQGDEVQADFTDYHWPLRDYAQALQGAGGVIHAMEELPATRSRGGQAIGPPAYFALLASRSANRPV